MTVGTDNVSPQSMFKVCITASHIEPRVDPLKSTNDSMLEICLKASGGRADLFILQVLENSLIRTAIFVQQ